MVPVDLVIVGLAAAPPSAPNGGYIPRGVLKSQVLPHIKKS